MLLWVGSIIFIIIQRTYIRREKNKFDRFSEHNTMMDSMRQKEGSMISGATGYYSGNMSNFGRGKLQPDLNCVLSLKFLHGIYFEVPNPCIQHRILRVLFLVHSTSMPNITIF